MAHFIGVVHRAQTRTARDRGFVAFSHGDESAVRRLSPGDTVIYYAPKSDFDGDPVRAFVAPAEVTGEAPHRTDYPGGRTAWVRAATFAKVREVPVRPLLDRLSFVRDPRHWGLAFRRGKFSITPDDHALIAGLMQEGA